jgi:hypothetical protein
MPCLEQWPKNIPVEQPDNTLRLVVGYQLPQGVERHGGLHRRQATFAEFTILVGACSPSAPVCNNHPPAPAAGSFGGGVEKTVGRSVMGVICSPKYRCRRRKEDEEVEIGRLSQALEKNGAVDLRS